MSVDEGVWRSENGEYGCECVCECVCVINSWMDGGRGEIGREEDERLWLRR